MRIGIDCDGVLRDLIGRVRELIIKHHPEYKDQLLPCKDWNWEEWLPFWSGDRTEQFVFEEHFDELFGPNTPAYDEAIEDWPKLNKWAKENNHELVLVSAQRSNCIEPTKKWLMVHGFDFKEMHFTNKKHLVDVDILIDDSPAKLSMFEKKSINNGAPICFNRPWNTKSQKTKMTINRLSEIISRVFG